jgi:hypothetical protein
MDTSFHSRLREGPMAEAGVRLTTHRRFGQSVIMKPFTVEIDGVAVGQARWNRPEFFTIGPGRRRLTVSFPYLWKKRLGEATLEFDARADQTIDAEYRLGGLVRARPSLSIAGAALAP